MQVDMPASVRDSNSMELVIDSVRVDDDGDYICTASNRNEEEASATINLIVECKF